MATTANHVLLRRITLSASASSVTFDSIPQTGYTDLKIVVSARTDRANYTDGIQIRFNNDSASNYSDRVLFGYGTGVGSAANGPTTWVSAGKATASTATASTFGNSEVYIPNYTGSSQKSLSADAVTENNAASGWQELDAGLWTGTAAITSVALLPALGTNFVAGSSFSLYGIANAATTPALAPKADGGDIIKTDGTYWYHAFLSSGSFKPQVNLTADVLVVAGGGGGGVRGNRGGSGGGAGGLLGFTSQSLTNATSYVCTVGAGGAGDNGTNSHTNGGNSKFASLTTVIGGGKGASDTANGSSGGSGAGGWLGESGYAGTSGQGYAGGAGCDFITGGGEIYVAGGGGGAGGTGYAGVRNGGSGGTNGAGGVGSSAYSSWGSATNTGQNVSGTYYYAGGGGGGSGAYSGGSAYGLSTGGYGGGGSGNGSASTGAVSGTAGTGGGGGGANAYYGGAGGSGIIIIRYPV